MTTLFGVVGLVFAAILFTWFVIGEAQQFRSTFVPKPPSLNKLRRQMTDRKHVDLSIDIIAISAGTQRFGNMDVESNNWIAATTIGGITFRGTRATDAVTAIQALLMTLANPQVRSASEPDPVVGLSMAMEGTTIDKVVGAPTGQPTAPELDKPTA